MTPDNAKRMSAETIAWRSSEDWERRAKIYEAERDELKYRLQTWDDVHAEKLNDLQRQLAEAHHEIDVLRGDLLIDDAREKESR